MFVRRAFYYWQVAAFVLLPLWILIGWSIFGGSGWQFLVVLLACGALALALGAVVVITNLRKGVRATKTLSWLDVTVLAVWHASIIATGFLTPATSILSVAVVVLGLVAFWATLWQLFRETRRRMQSVFDTFQATAQMGAAQMHSAQTGAGGRPPVVAQGEYIVIETARDRNTARNSDSTPASEK